MIQKANKIFLTGFMGAGKTSVGRYLARLLTCRFVDLDKEIVKKEGRSIEEIFATDGEKYFRDCETSILMTIESNEPAVYATGGGLILREENRAWIRKLGLIVYLRAEWTTLQRRLQNSKGRPLADPKQGWAEIKQRWDDRQGCYTDADLIIDTDGMNPEQVARATYKALCKERGK